MINLKCMLMMCSVLVSLSAYGQVASFTQEEIKNHKKNVAELVSTTSDCLDSVYADHLDFFAQWGISKYYGDRNPKYATLEKRKAALKLYGKPPELINELEPISCIGLTMRCLSEGFDAVNMGETWDKIYSELKKDKKFLGTDLQKNLINLGWKSYYWNPNPENNDKWDKEDQKLNPLKPNTTWNPVWGGHQARYKQALKGYYFEKALIVNDATSLVGFKDVQPAFFKEIPLFIGIAHAGYHVFPGRHGEVIEAHSMRLLNSEHNLEFSEFNPLKSGGGPVWTASEKYRSGLIVVPNI